jgi:hypothetical protein
VKIINEPEIFLGTPILNGFISDLTLEDLKYNSKVENSHKSIVNNYHYL